MSNGKKNEKVCKAKLGPKKYNLKRHLERFHSEFYKHHVAAEQAQMMQSDATSSAAANKQQTISNFFRNEKFTLSMTKEKFKRHLIQLVVGNGVATRVLSSPAFIGVNGEMAKKPGITANTQHLQHDTL